MLSCLVDQKFGISIDRRPRDLQDPKSRLNRARKFSAHRFLPHPHFVITSCRMKKEIKEANRFVEVITTVLENESENEGLESITAISQRMQGLTSRTYPDAQLSYSNLIEIGWALQASLVNKSINLGTTNAQRIDLALKVRSRGVISPMHSLTSLKILA